MRILVTGSAGFIGFNLSRRLLAEGHDVAGFAGFFVFFVVSLKRARHALLEQSPKFRPVVGALENADLLRHLVADVAPEIVLHFAAQAGVRYSFEDPLSYVSGNLVGTFNLLEALRASPPRHLLMASTSSVYGASTAKAFSETDRTDYPVSIYASTKRGTESLSHSYAHLFGIPTTCLRLFTVYGPWGRPDMAALKFASAIDRGDPIDVYGDGTASRDYTYIDDVVEAVTRLIAVAPTQRVLPVDSLSPAAPWRVVNIAGGRPVSLGEFIAVFEAAVGKPATFNRLPLQPGDVHHTRADTSLLEALIGYVPQTPLPVGAAAVVDWYRSYAAQT